MADANDPTIPPLPKIQTSSFFRRRNLQTFHSEEGMQPGPKNSTLQRSQLKTSEALLSNQESPQLISPTVPNMTNLVANQKSTNPQPLFSIDTRRQNNNSHHHNNPLTSTGVTMPQYKTHGIAINSQTRNMFNPSFNQNQMGNMRKNRTNRSYNNSYKGGMSSEDRQTMVQEQKQAQQLFQQQNQNQNQFQHHQSNNFPNKNNKNSNFNNQHAHASGPKRRKGGRGGHGGGGGGQSGHRTVEFHPRNLIKESFFEDPWTDMAPKKATAEEVRRATDSRSSKRLFNAAVKF